MPVLPSLAAQMGKLRSGERAWLVQGYLARKGLSKRPGRRGGGFCVVPGGLGVKAEVAVRPPERARPGALRSRAAPSPGGPEAPAVAVPAGVDPSGKGREWGKPRRLGPRSPCRPWSGRCGRQTRGGKGWRARAARIPAPHLLPRVAPGLRATALPLQGTVLSRRKEWWRRPRTREVGRSARGCTARKQRKAEPSQPRSRNSSGGRVEMRHGVRAWAGSGEPVMVTTVLGFPGVPPLPGIPEPGVVVGGWGRGRAGRAEGRLPARGLGGWEKLPGGAGKALCVAFCPHTPL